MADVYPRSGVRIPEDADEVEDPDEGLNAAGFRFLDIPYILTERRIEGRRGNRDWTADGRREYSIEGSFVRGRKSERGRLDGGVLETRWRSCAIAADGI